MPSPAPMPSVSSPWPARVTSPRRCRRRTWRRTWTSTASLTEMTLWLQARCLLCFTGWRAQSRSRPDRPCAHGKSATKLDRLVLWLASIAPWCDRFTCNDQSVRSLATSLFAFPVVFEAPGSNLRASFLRVYGGRLAAHARPPL